jgi:hypothetical protein
MLWEQAKEEVNSVFRREAGIDEYKIIGQLEHKKPKMLGGHILVDPY